MSGGERMRPVWAKAGGITVEAADVLLDLKLRFDRGYLDGLARRKIAAAIASKRGVAVTEDELEDALASFYAERGAFEEEQIAALLQSLRVDDERVRAWVGETALIEKARSTLVTDDEVSKRFGAEQYGYARAATEVFVFATAGAARELMLAAREHELEPEDGEPRELVRRKAPDEIAAMLFASEPGEMVGPAEADDGSFEVYLLRKRQEAVLNEDLAAEIREAMFDGLIETELACNPITFEA
jgi:hypothetical protein